MSAEPAAAPEPSVRGEVRAPRQLAGAWARYGAAVAVGWAAFVLWTSGHGPLPSVQNDAVFLGVAFALGLPTYAGGRRGGGRPTVLDLVLAGVGIFCCAYTAASWERLINVVTDPEPVDYVVGVASILLALELTRRVIGMSMVVIAALLVLYALFGNNVPGVFAHRGFAPEDILEALYLGTNGMWGTVSGIVSTNVAIFIIFGAVIYRTGGSEAFKDVALVVAGRQTGGAGKVATIASGLFGMISGSAAANAATVGNFTIQLMKRLGYSAELAGAIESVASTGGQIMPPIMGAAAFVMAEMISTPYAYIAAAAAIPAVLYYLGCGAAVHFTARRLGHHAVPRELIPRARELLSWRRSAPLTVPVAILILMLADAYTPSAAAFYATLAAIVLYLIGDLSRSGLVERGRTMLAALEQGGRGLVILAVLGASADVIIGLFGLTGLGVKISAELIALSGGSLLAALALTALVCTVLGMGVTTTADYVLASSVIGPALASLGMAKLNAHMFIFYFAASSALTPPVCAAVFVAAGIAGSDWLKTAYRACIIGIVAFVVPFVFAYNPALLLQGSLLAIVTDTARAAAATVVGAAALAGMLAARLSAWFRLALGLAAVLTVWPDPIVWPCGIALGAVLLLLHYRTRVAPASSPDTASS
ncbi:MAG: TRAP transporter permease [Acidobacteriota bacterium]